MLRAAVAILLGVGPLLGIGTANAAAVTSESTVSVATEYNSNPYMAPDHASAAESAAVMANVPITYHSDSGAQSFELLPKLRLAGSHGDAQLLSDYQYLDADWQLATERSHYTAAGGWHRDSTFYNVYENAQLHGRALPRTEATFSLGWQYALDELSSLQLGGSYDQVNYSQRSGVRFQNYRYVQGSLTYERRLTELLTSDTSIRYGQYTDRDQQSSNQSRFAQTSLTRTLSESWKATAQVGYSRVNSDSRVFLCCELVPVDGGYTLLYVPVRQSSSGGTVSYALSASRTTDRWTAGFSASRSIQPSSTGALLTQDIIGVNGSAPVSERWSVNAALQAAQQSDTLQRGSDLGRTRYFSGSLGVNWNVAERWTVAMQGAYSTDRVSEPSTHGSGVSISLTATRELGLIRL